MSLRYWEPGGGLQCEIQRVDRIIPGRLALQSFMNSTESLV